MCCIRPVPCYCWHRHNYPARRRSSVPRAPTFFLSTNVTPFVFLFVTGVDIGATEEPLQPATGEVEAGAMEMLLGASAADGEEEPALEGRDGFVLRGAGTGERCERAFDLSTVVARTNHYRKCATAPTIVPGRLNKPSLLCGGENTITPPFVHIPSRPGSDQSSGIPQTPQEVW